MQFDVMQPIQSIDTDRDREEVLLVSFDGFIKNTSEGIVRTMLRDTDEWIDRYPDLLIFDDMNMDEIYDVTILMQPIELMTKMCRESLSLEEIYHDIDEILPQIYLENSKLTQFEYSLFRLLKESKIRKCYIYREGYFFQNEIDYLNDQYREVFSKITLIDGKNLPAIFEEVKPTTLFLTDPAFVFGYIEENVKEEDIEGTMFIILNNTDTVEYNEQSKKFEYTQIYSESVDYVNDVKAYAIGTMYNFSIGDIDSDEEEE